MDKSAIEAIKNNQAFNIESLKHIDSPAVIIPETSNVVSLEYLNDRPNQFRAHFRTHLVDEFANYFIKNKMESSAIYIDTETMSAEAILDHGDRLLPRWGRHTAELTLTQSAAFADITQNKDTIKSQQELIDLLTDWEENVTFFDSEKKVIPFQAGINRLRKITLKKLATAEIEQGDFKSNASAMESIEMSSGQDKMPAFFTFQTVPYQGFPIITLSCRLRAVTTENKASIKYRIGALQAQEEIIANAFRDIIVSSTNDNANITIGTIQMRP